MRVAHIAVCDNTDPLPKYTQISITLIKGTILYLSLIITFTTQNLTNSRGGWHLCGL